MTFSYGMEKMERFLKVVDKDDMYSRFWDVIDGLLNSILFVLIGLTVLRITPSAAMLQTGIAAIIAVLISRAVGVALPTAVSRTKKIPGGYSLTEYTVLMTWSALKGGLSLALVLSTQSALPSATYTLLLNATYIIILFTVIVQGLTTKKVYRKIEQHKANRIRKESDLNCA